MVGLVDGAWVLGIPGIGRGTPGGSLLAVERGRPVELVGAAGLGLTRVGLGLLAEPSRTGPVAVVDVRGWVSPAAAWEAGVDESRLVVVRCPDPALWPKVVAALLEGVPGVLAEVPAGVRDADLRRLAALARARGSRVVLRPLRGELAPGVSHLRLRGVEVAWEGADGGHGRLGRRRLVLEASGKGAGGMLRQLVVEDAGADDLRVVSRLAVGSAGRAAG